MSNPSTHPRIEPNRAKVAALFGIPESALREFIPNFGGRGFSTIAIHCRHNYTADLSTGLAMRDYTVYPTILVDEENIFYGLAGPCICGKVFYIPPTRELWDLAQSFCKQVQLPSQHNLLTGE